MAVGDNISNINSKAADVAAKAQAAKAQAQVTVAEAKAKVDAAKAQARAAKKKAQELRTVQGVNDIIQSLITILPITILSMFHSFLYNIFNNTRTINL